LIDAGVDGGARVDHNCVRSPRTCPPPAAGAVVLLLCRPRRPVTGSSRRRASRFKAKTPPSGIRCWRERTGARLRRSW